MSLMNTFILDLDLKTNSYISEPSITAYDTIRFVINVTDDGLPFDLTNSTVYTLSSVRPDGVVVLKSGTKTGTNQMTFDLGSTELMVPGRVEAKIQIYDTNGRVSTLRFSYMVDKDPSQDYIPSTDEQTLIEQVLGQGPAILEAAEEATENANDAATNANTTASNIQAAEALRVTAESARVTAETTRKNAETARVTAETTRAANETARGTAETGRVNAEAARVTAETTRASNETARATAESARVTAETTRASRETARVTAETTRANNETARVTAETTRAANETARGTAETGRVNAESARVTAETTRVNAETARGTAESGRVTAETTRASNETARVTAESARITAETTRASNETTRQTNETTRQNNETARQTAINAIIHRGAYAAGTAYVKNNSVSYNGSTYRCILNTTGNLPTNTTYWALEASKGADGTGQIVSVSSTTTDLTIGGTSTDPTFTVNATTAGGVQASKLAKTNASGRVGDSEKLGGQASSYYATATSVTTNTDDIEVLSEKVNDSPAATAINLVNGLQVLSCPVCASLNNMTIKGRTLVNLLGRDGNCEDTGKFSAAGSTISLDTSNKLYGNASYKVTMTSGTASIYRDIPVSSSKSYLFLSSVKNVDVTNSFVRVSTTADVNIRVGNTINGDTTKFVTNYVAFGPTELGSNTTIRLKTWFTGASTKIAYLDGIAVYEITPAEKTYIDGLSIAAAQAYIDKYYPYVDDIKRINTPYVIKYGENLTPPFNEWITGDGYDLGLKPITEPYTFTVIGKTAGLFAGYLVDVPVIAGQTYTFSVPVTVSNIGGTITYGAYYNLVPMDALGNSMTGLDSAPYATTNGTTILGKTVTIPANAVKLRIILSVEGTSTGDFTFSKPMLNLGSTTKPFKPRNDDMLAFPNIQLDSNIDGSVYDTLFERDGKFFVEKRFKDIVLDGSLAWTLGGDFTGVKQAKMPQTAIGGIGIAASGTAVKYDGKIVPQGSTSIADLNAVSADGNFYIGIADTDSGWGESYVPTADEIKAYFNGWVMYEYSSANVANKYNGTGTKGWAYRLSHYGGSPTAANMTGGTNILPTTPAPYLGTFTPYKLTYQLANPTFEEIQVEGSIAFHEGSNQIEVGQGIIVRERAYPQLDTGSLYWINHTVFPSSQLRNRTNRVLTVYKNGKIDNTWNIRSNVTYGYGGCNVWTNNYDPTATYEVSYLALDQYLLTSPTQSVTGESASNLKTVVDSLATIQADNEARISETERLARQIYNVPQKTTRNITLYVDSANGSDNNDGSAGKPLKTIQAAVNRIPQIINHVVVVQVAAGTYNEDVSVMGFYCGVNNGILAIKGATTVTTTHSVNSFTIRNCFGRVSVEGFNTTSTNREGISVFYSHGWVIYACNVIGTSIYAGILAQVATGRIESCIASNRSSGINIQFYCQVYIQQCSGTGNVNYGVYSAIGSTVSIDALTTITGGIAPRGVENGGMIVPSVGVINPWGDNTRAQRSRTYATSNTAQNFTAGISTKVLFQVTQADHLSEYNAGTSRVTVKSAGVYDVKGLIRFSSGMGTSVNCIVMIYKNSINDKFLRADNGSSQPDPQIPFSGTIDLAAGDYLEIYVNTSSATTSGVASILEVTRIA